MDTKKTVVIVDDDALVLESIDLLLSMAEGYQSIRALGSAGAISHLANAQVDVLVADVILAGNMSGIELCHQVSRQHPAMAIVVITADNEVHRDDVPARWVFLRKPFGGEQLLQAIEQSLRQMSGQSSRTDSAAR